MKFIIHIDMESNKKPRDVKKLYKPPAEQDNSGNYCRLIIVIVISFAFIAGEFVGGVIAHSIAIISDAMHLITDLVGFVFSFLFIYLARKAADEKMSFGYHRMELLGALANIAIIWILILFVVYQATLRIIDKQFVEEPLAMLITAAAGLVVNIVMYKVLHDGGSNSHGLMSEGCGHDHGEEHNHEHHNHSTSQKKKSLEDTMENLKVSKHQLDCFQKVCEDEDCNISVQQIHCHKGTEGIHKHQKKNYQKLPPINHRHDQNCTNDCKGAEMVEIKVGARKSGLEQSDGEKVGLCQIDHEHQNTCYLTRGSKKPHLNMSEEIEPPKKSAHKHDGKCQHNHEHEHEHNHQHEHEHPKQEKLQCAHEHKKQAKCGHQHSEEHKCGGHNHQHQNNDKKQKNEVREHKHEEGHKCGGHDHDHHDHGHAHGNAEDEEARNSNLGMQAAVLHALSDMIMSIGLLIASLVIYFAGTDHGQSVTQWNAWHLFDPIGTYVFSIISLISTFPVIKSCYNLMMESTPVYIKVEELKKTMEEVEGVIDVHDIHVWDLKPGKTVLIAHVFAEKDMQRLVLIKLSDIARQQKIYHSTFQIEEVELRDDHDYILCHHDIH